MNLIRNTIKGIKQRFFYIKNWNKGFSPIFLLPGYLREKLGEHKFFSTLIKGNQYINIKRFKGYIMIHAGKFNFKFPNGSFYEGDFFDIIYPNLHIYDQKIETFVYKNPFYESEGKYLDFGATLKNGDYVIDAGANVGTFSVIASNEVDGEGKVFAFEPIKNISNILKENVQANNCVNVVVENIILGDKNGSTEFFYDLEHNYNASSTKFKKAGSKSIRLEQITLDKYVKDNKIERVDFIKADIEGAERDLLRGAEQTIKKFRPKISMRTYHLPDDPEVLRSIIKEYVPEYKIVLNKKTIYAWI